MTSISSTQQGIPVGSARSLHDDQKLRFFKASDPEKKIVDESVKHATAHASNTQEQRDAQIAKQRAVEAHTVFRSNGKIVAYIGHENGATFARGGFGSMDMSGGTDAIAQRMEEQLGEFYGDVEVQYYPTGSGITSGAVEDEMFGRGPKVSPPSSTSTSESSENAPSTFVSSRANFSVQSLEEFWKFQ